MSVERTRFEFGPFRLNPVERTLHRGADPVALPPKAFDTLVVLVERAGQLVTKDELLREVWPDTFVEEGNLSYTVSLIRKALGDSEGGGLVETVPKRGYRFTAAVAARTESGTAARRAAHRRLWWWVAGGLAACAAGAGVLAGLRGTMSHGAPEAATVRSLAVLPLANLSGDPEQEYFTDGMTHALTAELSRLGSLHVVSFASASRFRKTSQSAPEIGRALGVDGVIAGSVLRDANQVRITVQLVHAASDRQLWAESFVRDLRGVLALQSDVARAVADAIRLALPARPPGGPTSRRLVDQQAYDSYLRGRHYWRKLTPDGMKAALAHFEAAIARDPYLAPAYVGVAEVYTWSFGRLAGFDPELTTRAALAAVTKALTLDDTLADAHAVNGWIREWHLWDFEAAERSYKRAIELDPGAAQARSYYALFRLQHSDFAGAEAEARLASKLDPLSTVSRSTLGWVLFWSGRHADAIEVYRQVLELDASMPLPHYNLGLCYEQQGRFAEAEASYRRAIELGGAWPLRGMLARALALSGNREAAARLVEEMKATQPLSRYMLALALLALDDRQGAIAELERAVAEREPWVANLKRDHFFFTPLRGDSRFEALAHGMNFPGGYPAPLSARDAFHGRREPLGR